MWVPARGRFAGLAGMTAGQGLGASLPPSGREKKVFTTRVACWTIRPRKAEFLASGAESPYDPKRMLAMTMLTHSQVWSAIDRLAERAGLSASGLAKRAGL